MKCEIILCTFLPRRGERGQEEAEKKSLVSFVLWQIKVEKAFWKNFEPKSNPTASNHNIVKTYKVQTKSLEGEQVHLPELRLARLFLPISQSQTVVLNAGSAGESITFPVSKYERTLP